MGKKNAAKKKDQPEDKGNGKKSKADAAAAAELNALLVLDVSPKSDGLDFVRAVHCPNTLR